MEGGILNPRKIAVAKKIRNYDVEKANDDLHHLMELIPPKQSDLTSNAGNKYLDSFFFPYRLDTVGRHKMSFYDFHFNDKVQHNKEWIKRLMDSLIKKGTPYEKAEYSAFNLYFSAISSFKPLNAAYVYGKYNPTSVLDFSAGWGGRLLGAMLYEGMQYTGFDTNTELRKPYKEMIDDLGVKDRARIIFKDSSKVDYSKYNYDMVFTSPPYYTIEKYQNMPDYESYEDWVEKFLKPVVTNTYKYMKTGHYILNIPKTIYPDVRKILGKATSSFPLAMNIRNATIKGKKQKTYSEKVYVWKK